MDGNENSGMTDMVHTELKGVEKKPALYEEKEVRR